MAVTVPSAESQTLRKELVAQASIIFVGTVTENNASLVAGIPASPRTAVVRVGEVLDRPAAVSIAPGDLVTVETANAGELQPGARTTFYTNGLAFSDRLAVSEVGHETGGAQPLAAPAGAEATTAGTDDVARIRSELSDADLRSRIKEANLVVVGRVIEVREPTRATLQPRPRRVSEHDPQLKLAIVAVEAAIKGANVGDQVALYYSPSEDVAHFDAPKLQVGQTGTFILDRQPGMAAPTAAVAGVERPAYVVRQSGQVLPTEEAQRVRELAQ
jgi:hypothetical protein